MLVPTPPTLIETSFADAVEIIAAATELPEQTRRHWTTSLRMIAKALDKPVEVIPARYSAVRGAMAQLHEVPLGWTSKTLSNHKSNAKAALLWLSKEKGVPEYGAPLLPCWDKLRAKIPDSLIRARLSSFMRFCSSNHIEPHAVDEEVIERFLAYRIAVGKPANSAYRRLVARAWNHNVASTAGWLEEYRQGGLTAKNQEFLRQVLTPGVWGRVLKLPLAMLAEARRHRERGNGVRAAVTAQLAVSIAILSVAPVRLGNLASIRLGFNLIKPDGPDSNYWLVFPDYDVKNRVKLDYPLPEYLTRLIDEYVYDFRPALVRGRNEDWLFPGARAEHKGKICLSGQITGRIHNATGMRMTVHQFRHAAGALILTKRPVEYELVRRLLGHRNVQTTIDSYIGLENIQASEIFSKIVMEHLGAGGEGGQP
jgi:integrase